MTGTGGPSRAPLGAVTRLVAATTLGTIVAGLLGAAVSVLTVAAVTWRPIWGTWLAGGTIVVVGALSVLESPLGTDAIATWARDRPDAHTAGLLAALVWLTIGVVAPSPNPDPPEATFTNAEGDEL